MNSNLPPPSSHAHTDCYGHFRINDPICRHQCAISIRCVIERDKNACVEMVEDFFPYEGMYTVIQ